ncbi:MAG: DoxX family protein, partial [Gemmatimonadaceae bacterium]
MENARGSNTVLVWVLSVLLALLFLSTGIPKLFGANTWVFQAASMNGFPAWIKITVGIVEVCGAIALLIPRVATLGAVSLAILMLPATATQIMSHESGAWLPVIVCIVLLVLIWQRNPAEFRQAWDSLFHAPHPVLREGVITGVIGATCLAAWFFVVDVISGHIFLTPATLGHALFSVLGPGVSQSRGIDILVYTIFHYLVFIGVGIIAALVTRAARHEP